MFGAVRLFSARVVRSVMHLVYTAFYGTRGPKVGRRVPNLYRNVRPVYSEVTFSLLSRDTRFFSNIYVRGFPLIDKKKTLQKREIRKCVCVFVTTTRRVRDDRSGLLCKTCETHVPRVYRANIFLLAIGFRLLY